MGKKILIIMVLFLIFILQVEPKKEVQKEKKKEEKVEEQIEEKRAIYISYIELQKYIKGKTVSDAKKNIDRMIQNINDFHFNMILLQVRSFSDAIYESKYFPWCSCVTDDVNSSPGFDVLDYFIKKSHNKNIELHAWVNPYRISNKTDTSTLSKDSYAYQFLESGDAKVIEKGIFYNPASSKVQKLIVDGITEILENYKVDGIHFDDYFYPSVEIDSSFYNDYLKTHKDISVSEYHLMNVNSLVEKVHEVTKKYHVLFGIAPEGNIENNYATNSADVYLWGSSDLYVDYLMPQIYYGFENEAKPFYEVLTTWEELVNKSNVRLLPALAFYKINTEDKYAKSGINEWIENDDIIMRQVLLSRNTNHYDGFSIFRYDNLFPDAEIEEVMQKEIKNLKKIIPN